MFLKSRNNREVFKAFDIIDTKHVLIGRLNVLKDFAHFTTFVTLTSILASIPYSEEYNLAFLECIAENYKKNDKFKIYIVKPKRQTWREIFINDDGSMSVLAYEVQYLFQSFDMSVIHVCSLDKYDIYMILKKLPNIYSYIDCYLSLLEALT